MGITVPNLLITISSQSGLQLGQIGNVASNLDPIILSSTIPALKSMVTSEITNTDSSFMTGTTDQTRFGTFALKTDEGEPIVITYLLSYTTEEYPDPMLDRIVEDLAITFGQQLSRMINIAQFASQGKSIPFRHIIQAFINSLMLSKLRIDFPSSNEIIEETILEVAKELLSNPKSSKTLSFLKSKRELKKRTNLWEKGVLRKTSRHELEINLGYELIGLVLAKHPISLFYCQRPRELVYQVITIFNQLIEPEKEEAYKLIQKSIKTVIAKKLKTELAKIKIADSHRIITVLEEKLLREALITSISEHPLIAFLPISETTIRKEFSSFIQENLPPTLPDILMSVVSSQLPPENAIVLSGFFKKFFSMLYPVAIDGASQTLIRVILSEFASLKDIANKGKPLIPDETPKWKKEWEAFFKLSSSSRRKIQLSPFLGVLLVDASLEGLSEAIVNSINALMIGSTHQDNFARTLFNQYKEILPLITLGSILSDLGVAFGTQEIDFSQYFPSTFEILVSWARKDKLSVYIGDAEVKWTSPSVKKGENILSQGKIKLHPLIPSLGQEPLIIKSPEGILLSAKHQRITPNELLLLLGDYDILLSSLALAKLADLLTSHASAVTIFADFNNTSATELLDLLRANQFPKKVTSAIETIAQNIATLKQALLEDPVLTFSSSKTTQKTIQAIEKYSLAIQELLRLVQDKSKKSARQFERLMLDFNYQIVPEIEFLIKSSLKNHETINQYLSSSVKKAQRPLKMLFTAEQNLAELEREIQMFVPRIVEHFERILISGFRPTDWETEGRPGLFQRSHEDQFEELLKNLREILRLCETRLVIEDSPLEFEEGNPLVEILSFRIDPDHARKLEDLFHSHATVEMQGRRANVRIALPIESSGYQTNSYLTIGEALLNHSWRKSVAPLISTMKLAEILTELLGGEPTFWKIAKERMLHLSSN